jgi:hypothetical protein
MLRIGFRDKGSVEFLVFHERGPQYVSPEDLVDFIVRKVNGGSTRKILAQIAQG